MRVAPKIRDIWENIRLYRGYMRIIEKWKLQFRV